MARRVVVVIGTRPEAVKLAPLVRALKADNDLHPHVVVTAQHRQILDQVLEEFEVVPDVDLGILRAGQTLDEVTVRALAGLAPVLDRTSPELVIVQGDTTSTLTGALSAFYRRVPVVHLEAGLRTGDPLSPYPEEMNRRLVSQLSALHLAPTPSSRANLLSEGVQPDRIVVTGNTVIDALLSTVERQRGEGDPVPAELAGGERRLVLVTAHRRESWGEGMGEIARALAELSRRPDLAIMFPIHPNPVVRRAVLPLVEHRPNVTVVEPFSYPAFCRLMARAHLILTDSGGIQEEGPALGKPVVVLRETTERPEAVAAGTATLVGPHCERIVEAVGRLLDDDAAYRAMANAVNPYGDGRATGRAVAAIRHFLGMGGRPEDFAPAPAPALAGALT